jgi:putative oxidoreductase
VRYVILLARLLIGGLFVYASVHKILDPANFAVAIRNYMIIPPGWSNVAAMVLPWIELVAGLLLIAGVLTKPSAVLTTGMMVVFVGALSYAYIIGLDINCGCFGSSVDSLGRIGPFEIMRDSILLAVSFLIIVADRGDFSLACISPWRPRTCPASDDGQV